MFLLSSLTYLPMTKVYLLSMLFGNIDGLITLSFLKFSRLMLAERRGGEGERGLFLPSTDIIMQVKCYWIALLMNFKNVAKNVPARSFDL